MKMVLAIVQEDDCDGLLETLAKNNVQATKTSTTGGFLKTGNCTVLMGVEEAEVAGVIAIIRSTCHTRTTLINALPYAASGPEGALLAQPVEVQVGGAHVFVWDVEQPIRAATEQGDETNNG